VVKKNGGGKLIFQANLTLTGILKEESEKASDKGWGTLTFCREGTCG